MIMPRAESALLRNFAVRVSTCFLEKFATQCTICSGTLNSRCMIARSRHPFPVRKYAAVRSGGMLSQCWNW